MTEIKDLYATLAELTQERDRYRAALEKIIEIDPERVQYRWLRSESIAREALKI